VRATANRPEFEQLIREVVPETFGKCLEDGALFRWGDNIQADILDMVCGLLDLLHARLRNLGPSPEADEADLVPMLSSLAPALDPCANFHVKHRTDALPPRARNEPFGDEWAEARPDVEDLAVRARNPKKTVSALWGSSREERCARRRAAAACARTRSEAAGAYASSSA
jgi:hypothetical protein